MIYYLSIRKKKNFWTYSLREAIYFTFGVAQEQPVIYFVRRLHKEQIIYF